ncbi:MAG: response regulator [Deltaproteobacteria bacterium]|nr:response regulator [Deltaproteobacteria bacterium]
MMSQKPVSLSLKGEGIRRIFIIAFGAVSIIPPLALFYVVYSYGIANKLDVLMLFTMVVLLSFAGMLLVWQTLRKIRSLRDAIIDQTSDGKKKQISQEYEIQSLKLSEVKEIGQILVEFHNLLSKLNDNTQKLERIVYQITTLSELAELSSSISDMDELLRAVLSRTMKGISADSGSIMLFDQGKEGLAIASAEGLDPEIIRNSVVKIGEGIAGKVFEKGEPIMVGDLSKNEYFKQLSKTGQGSFICLPMKVKNRPLGVLNLAKKSLDYAFTENDLKFLTTLINHIAFALENARLLSEAKENARDLGEILREKGQELDYARQQAAKMEAISTLAGGIAHDFNNLLMGILGNVSLMQTEVNPDNPLYRRLTNIEKQVQSGSHLTKQLLGFARGGKYDIKPTDINDLVKKTSEMFSRARKEITIHEEYHDDLWISDVDQVQMEQVLLNLFVNAWQAMPGGGQLSIRTENVILDKKFVSPYQLEEGRYIKITVADTGTGMDGATMSRIFEPFFTTKELSRGTGLGLASAYGIIRNHKGIIDVSSEKGKGTTFDLYLPASLNRPLKESTPAIEPLMGTETILLVDDEEMIIEVGEEILKILGYKVLTARSGKEAIEIYKNNMNKIDMIILDIIMPDMNGKQTHAEIKSINPVAKILISSGYSLNGQTTEILELGYDGFIQKPYNIGHCSVKIREILDRK